MEVIYNLSMLGAVIAFIGFVIGVVRPATFKRLIGARANRKSIMLASTGLFLGLATLGGITEPASVKQARIDKERASIVSSQQAEAAKTKSSTSVKPIVQNQTPSDSSEPKTKETTPAPAPTPKTSTHQPAAVAPTKPVSTPTPTTQAAATGMVKKSTNDICHAPGTTYYNRTTNFTSYSTLDTCLQSGGRLPKR